MAGVASKTMTMAAEPAMHKVHALGFGHVPYRWKPRRGASTRLAVVYDHLGRAELHFRLAPPKKAAKSSDTDVGEGGVEVLRVPLSAVSVTAQDLHVKSLFDGNDRARPTCHARHGSAEHLIATKALERLRSGRMPMAYGPRFLIVAQCSAIFHDRSRSSCA